MTKSMTLLCLPYSGAPTTAALFVSATSAPRQHDRQRSLLQRLEALSARFRSTPA